MSQDLDLGSQKLIPLSIIPRSPMDPKIFFLDLYVSAAQLLCFSLSVLPPSNSFCTMPIRTTSNDSKIRLLRIFSERLRYIIGLPVPRWVLGYMIIYGWNDEVGEQLIKVSLPRAYGYSRS